MWASSKSIFPVESRPKCQKEFSAESVIASSSLLCLLIKLCSAPQQASWKDVEKYGLNRGKDVLQGLGSFWVASVTGAFLMVMWCLVGVV